MADPKSISELFIVVEESRKRVDLQLASIDARFKGLSTRIYFVVSLLLGLLASTALIYKEIGAVQKDVAVVQTNTENIRRENAETKATLAKLDASKIEASLGKLDSALAKFNAFADLPATIQATLVGVEARLKALPGRPASIPISLDSKETSIVREIIRMKEGTGEPSVKLGSIAPDLATLIPTPDKLLDQVTKLSATRYFRDDKGGFIIFVSALDNHVVAIVRAS